MKNYIVTGGIILATVIGVYWYAKDDSTDKKDPMPTSVAEPTDVTLSLTPQEVIRFVVIDYVFLDQPGFVSVREVIDGKMGQILEVSDYLEPGEYTNLTIDLFDIPAENVEPVVVLHKDNGDLGFNPSWDEVVVDGGQVVARYTRTGEFVETAILTPNQNASDAIAATVRYTDDGFEPKTVEVGLGETVRFVNESSGPMWVASNPHPSHLILSTFDQFGVSKPGEVYEYRFDESGEWVYHDHINASFEGVVIVK